MKINGSCHCGFITIEGEADPEETTSCHCTGPSRSWVKNHPRSYSYR